jgi:hypothetical protein
MARYPQSFCVSGLCNAQEASATEDICPVSVDIEEKPDRADAFISIQLIPPLKPPFPETMNREFHSSGRNRPKLNEEVGDDTTFTLIAHSAGRHVAGSGNGGEGCDQVPLTGTRVAFVIVACVGRKPERADGEHSNIGPAVP